jgi:molybdopterin-binding protein
MPWIGSRASEEDTVARQFYTASDAAHRLGISLDTLRRWDRDGRIKTTRDKGNRRLVPAREIERIRGKRSAEHLSARNRLPGTVSEVKVEGLVAQVELLVTDPVRIVAIVTADAVEELGLETGEPATAVVKATSVMVEHA